MYRGELLRDGGRGSHDVSLRQLLPARVVCATAVRVWVRSDGPRRCRLVLCNADCNADRNCFALSWRIAHGHAVDDAVGDAVGNEYGHALCDAVGARHAFGDAINITHSIAIAICDTRFSLHDVLRQLGGRVPRHDLRADALGAVRDRALDACG